MSITVFKSQHVRWLPDHTRLWAVYEGVDGRHHEEAHEYTHEHRTEMVSVRCLYDYALPQTQYMRIEPAQHPLLTDDYREAPTQVLPGTLRFIHIEDLLKLYRYVDHQGNVYAIHWDNYAQGCDRFRTLNGFKLNMYSTEFDHIVYPRHISQDNHLEPDEWADTTSKEQR